MGDRVAVLDKGRLQQVGPPRELYERPDNVFVASFIGSPQMNLMSADVGEGGATLTVRGQTLTVGDPALSGCLATVGSRAVIGIRPEHFVLASSPDGPLTMAAEAGVVEHLGATLLAHLDAGQDADPAVAHVDAEQADDLGRRRGELLAVLPSEADVATGQRIHVSVAPEKLYVFDPATGEAVRH